jgi:hypothetical protein
MYKLTVFVNLEDAENVKQAMFEAGAGKIGLYDSCCFETVGTGQFRPLKGANPYLGSIDSVEKVKELKIEMVCEEVFVKEVLKAMKASHPYEEPAYDVIELCNIDVL